MPIYKVREMENKIVYVSESAQRRRLTNRRYYEKNKEKIKKNRREMEAYENGLYIIRYKDNSIYHSILFEIETKDDPKYMILQYKDKEIKFMETYEERRGLKHCYMPKLIVCWSFKEINKVFYINIVVITNLKRNIVNELKIKNLEIQTMKIERKSLIKNLLN